MANHLLLRTHVSPSQHALVQPSPPHVAHSDAHTPPSSAVGDASVQRARRCHFAIFFPEDVPAKPVHMFFDREKDTIKVLEAAVAHAGLKLDRGRLVGSPEKLNLFTIDGDMLRTDLPLDAHLGSTIHPSSVLLLEKGNRVLEDRLDAVKLAVSQQSGGMGCSIL